MTDLRTQLQAGLSGSNTLERELGRGGMATVYLARDLLKVPYDLSPGWLRVDPTFDALRHNPRFQTLVEGR